MYGGPRSIRRVMDLALDLVGIGSGRILSRLAHKLGDWDALNHAEPSISSRNRQEMGGFVSGCAGSEGMQPLVRVGYRSPNFEPERAEVARRRTSTYAATGGITREAGPKGPAVPVRSRCRSDAINQERR